jgi:hypothetical protein
VSQKGSFGLGTGSQARWYSRLARRAVRPLALLLLLSGAGAALCAQTAAEQTRGQGGTTVGAKQIFAALTHQDRSTEMELLRGLRATLAHDGDPAGLAAARAQIDSILQAEAQRTGDMPPAVVLSALASRIDAAVAGLEEARRATPAAMPFRPPPWLLPGLVGTACTVAAALVACLMALTSLPPPPENASDTGDKLADVKRSLDESASFLRETVSAAGAASSAASQAVRAAGTAVSDIGSVAEDVQARLRGSVESAEARLRDAAAAAGQCEQWLACLPERLVEALARVEASGATRLDAIAASIADGTAALAAVAASLPATQMALQTTVDGLAKADRSSARVVGELAALALRTEERLPELINASVRAADEAAQSRGEAAARDASRPVMDAVMALGAKIERHTEKMSPERLMQAVAAIQARGGAAIEAAAERLAAAAAAVAGNAALVPAAHQALLDATASVMQSGKEHRAALVAAAARLSEGLTAAGSLPAHLETLAEVAKRLEEAAAAGQDDGRARLAEQAMQSASAMQGVADRMVETASRMDRALQAAEQDRAGATAEALAIQASQADSYASMLAALAARADASIAVLPAEASALAAAAADLREDAAQLGAAAERMEQAAAGKAGEAALSTAAGLAGAAMQETTAKLGQALADGMASAASAERLALDFERFLTVQAGRIAALLDSGDQVAARLEAAAAQAADPAGGQMAAMRTEAETEAARRAGDDAFAGLQKAIFHVQAVAARLESGMEAQEAALARVTQAASAVAASADQRAGPAAAETEVTLSQLSVMARQAECLRTATETMAASALAGELSQLSPDIVSHTPALLTTIETCIQQLRGAGTALALASDAHRKAA